MDPILQAKARRLAALAQYRESSRKVASPQDGKKTGDGTEWVGLFIPLPQNLADQFPTKKEGQDKSPPHVTLLYVGDALGREQELVDICQGIVSEELREPITAHLEPLDYFTHPEKDRRVAILPIRFSHRMAELRDRLKSALQDAGIEVGDSYTVYRPHATLDYLEGLDSVYQGEVPQGQWTFDQIEVWGASKVYTLKAGKSKVGFGNYTWKGPAAAERKWQEIHSRVAAFNQVYQEILSWGSIPDVKLMPYLRKQSGFFHKMTDLDSPFFVFAQGSPLRDWVFHNFGRPVSREVASLEHDFMDSLSILDRAVQLPEKYVDSDAPLSRYVDNCISSLKPYVKYLQRVVDSAGDRRFKYKGFQVENPNRISGPLLRNMLEGIDYVVSLFKTRGVLPALEKTLKSVVLRHPDEGEAAHGWHLSHQRQIHIISSAAREVKGRMLRNWVGEVFLHEVGHHIHLSLLDHTARKLWDSGWGSVYEAQREKADLGKVSHQDRKRFWDLLVSAKGNLKSIRLSGVDRMKFHAWLKAPTSGDPLVTPKNLRWTQSGKYIAEFLQDPERYVLEVRNRDPLSERGRETLASIWKLYADRLAVSDDFSGYVHPMLTEEDVAKYGEVDRSIAQAIEALQMPTEYAKHDEKEDFAETFVAFMAAPEHLSSVAKHRMQSALSMSGLMGRQIMRLADDKIAARPIKVDKPALMSLAQKIVTELPKYLKFRGDPSDSLYSQRGFNPQKWGFDIGPYVTNDVRGALVAVPVRVESEHADLGFGVSRKYVAGGSVESRSYRGESYSTKAGMTLRIDSARSPTELLANLAQVKKELYSVLIHEATHLRDLLLAGGTAKYFETGGGGAHGYLNDPTEIRAHMQQIVDEVISYVEKEGEEGNLWAGATEYDFKPALEKSRTWDKVRKFLTPKSKKLMLKGVHTGFMDALPDLQERFPREEDDWDDDDDWGKSAARPIPLGKGYLQRRAKEAASAVMLELSKWAKKGRHSWKIKTVGRIKQGQPFSLELEPLQVGKVLRKGQGFVPTQDTVDFWIQTDEKKASRQGHIRKTIRKATFGSHGDMRWIQVQLHSDMTPEYVEQHMRDLEAELYSVLIHEMTHVVELYENPDLGGTSGLSLKDHANNPLELRAFMQQVVDEVVQVGGDFRQALNSSPTYRQIRDLLTRKNHHKLVQGVWSAWGSADPATRVANRYLEAKGAPSWFPDVGDKVTSIEVGEDWAYLSFDSNQEVGLPIDERRAEGWKAAKEFSSEEARKKYLKEHPNADPKKHTVSKGLVKAEKPSLDPAKASALKNKAREAVKGLGSKILSAVKQETGEWKAVASGMKKLFSRKPLEKEEKRQLINYAIHQSMMLGLKSAIFAAVPPPVGYAVKQAISSAAFNIIDKKLGQRFATETPGEAAFASLVEESLREAITEVSENLKDKGASSGRMGKRGSREFRRALAEEFKSVFPAVPYMEPEDLAEELEGYLLTGLHNHIKSSLQRIERSSKRRQFKARGRDSKTDSIRLEEYDGSEWYPSIEVTYPTEMVWFTKVRVNFDKVVAAALFQIAKQNRLDTRKLVTLWRKAGARHLPELWEGVLSKEGPVRNEELGRKLDSGMFAAMYEAWQGQVHTSVDWEDEAPYNEFPVPYQIDDRWSYARNIKATPEGFLLAYKARVTRLEIAFRGQQGYREAAASHRVAFRWLHKVASVNPNEVQVEVETPAWTNMRVAAKYQKKKEVPKADGKGTTTVYEYSERQVQHRNREKAKRVEKLRGSIDKLRAQVKKDLKSEDEKTRMQALCVGLMDETYERVGNEDSAEDGHFGVTGWKVKHLTFSGGKATLKYVGKSGVSHNKVVEDKALVAALKDAAEGKGAEDSLTGSVGASEVNTYLKPFGITAKDVRGYHANSEVQSRLKEIRSKGGKLPEDKKEREKQLKKEFEQALGEAAKAVGHEPSTLKNQYLVPGLADAFLSKGEVTENMNKKSSSFVTLSFLEKLITEIEKDPTGWGSASPTAAALRKKIRRMQDPIMDEPPTTFPDLIEWLDFLRVPQEEKDLVRSMSRYLKGTPKTAPTNQEEAFTNYHALKRFSEETQVSWQLRGVDLESSEQAKGILAWTKAIKGLKGAPKKAWSSLVKKVRFSLPRGTEDASWEAGGTMVLVVGKQGRLSIPSLRSFLIHELGHAVDEKTRGVDQYLKLYGRPPYVSAYAETNASEDFAETYRAIVQEPRFLKRQAPEKYQDMVYRMKLGHKRVDLANRVASRWLAKVSTSAPSPAALKMIQLFAEKGKSGQVNVNILEEALSLLGWGVVETKGLAPLDTEYSRRVKGNPLQRLRDEFEVTILDPLSKNAVSQFIFESEEEGRALLKVLPRYVEINTGKNGPTNIDVGKVYFGEVGPLVEHPHSPGRKLFNYRYATVGVVAWDFISRSGAKASVIPNLNRGRLPDPTEVKIARFFTWGYKNGLQEDAKAFLEAGGSDVIERRKQEKELAVRSLENTGTCPACLQNVKMTSRRTIMRHGWEVQGGGWRNYGTWHSASCFGTGYSPWELSKKGAVDYRKALLDTKAAIEARVQTLTSGNPPVQYGRKEIQEGDRNYPQAKQKALQNASKSMEHLRGELRTLDARIASWTQQPLPGERVAKVAASGNELIAKTEKLIKDYEEVVASGRTGQGLDRTLGQPYVDWFVSEYRVRASSTPRGGKAIKQQADAWLWIARNAMWARSSPEEGLQEIKDRWEEFKPLIPDLVAKFSDSAGTKTVLREIKTSVATYQNLRGVATPTFKKYVKALDEIFNNLQGWRRKALAGDFKVALAGPDKFRGTASGRYNAPSDTLFVKATPKVMKRTGGTYASAEYILIHELGHRYEAKVGVPHRIEGTLWHTTRYSMSESPLGTSEAFAELFALGHFGITKTRGDDFGHKIEKFERLMSTGKMSSSRSPRKATKDKGEKENDEVERMNRKKPSKKPPRQDLRRNRMDEHDPDVDNLGKAEKDPDLSLNYKKVAIRQAGDDLLRALSGSSIRTAGKVPSDADKRKGDYWETEKGWGVWPPHSAQPTSAPDEEAAKRMSEGQDSAPEEAESEPQAGEEELAEEKAREEEKQKKRLADFDKMVGTLPSDQAGVLEGLSEKEKASLAALYAEEMEALTSESFSSSGQLKASAVATASKALKKGLRGLDKASPEKKAAMLAAFVFANNVVADPTMVEGISVNDQPKSGDALRARSMASYQQYRKASPELLEVAAKRLDEAMEKLDPESDEHIELDAIKSGMMLAAAVQGRQLPGADSVSPSFMTLARTLATLGEEDLLLKGGSDFTGPRGRATVREALDIMSDDELVEVVAGKDTAYSPIGEALLDEGGDNLMGAEQRAFARDLLKMMAVNDMTTIQGFLNALGADGYRGATTDPEKIAEEIRAKKSEDRALTEAVSKLVNCFAKAETQEDIENCRKDMSELEVQDMCSTWAAMQAALGGEPPKGDPSVARIRHVCETGEISVLDEEVKPWDDGKNIREDSIASQRQEWLKNIDDPEERERILKMTPGEFKAYRAAVLKDEEDG